MIKFCIGNASPWFGHGSGKSDIDRKQMKPSISNHKVKAHRPQVYQIRSFQVLIVVGLASMPVHVLVGSATPTLVQAWLSSNLCIRVLFTREDRIPPHSVSSLGYYWTIWIYLRHPPSIFVSMESSGHGVNATASKVGAVPIRNGYRFSNSP
jgi:hypothetical protein